MSQIEYIKIERLEPHPKNPRRDLGDLTELAESIRANGVMQNLTVIGKTVSPDGEGDTYTIIIGHRRHAAAKLAGLSELPCMITSMDERQQLAAMLLENIQRADLTVYEQAQGFQMMLDLGETVKSISEQTGFSDTTVRKRVKLLELDKERFAQAGERGATLADYEELGKIKDIKTRNKVLEKIGTENFAWALESALSEEKRAENKAVIIEALKKFAKKIKDKESSQYQYSQYIGFNSYSFTPPKDAESANYFYTESAHNATLYREKEKQEKPKKTPEQIERERKVKELTGLFKRAYGLRLAFAQGLKITGKMAELVNKKAAEALFSRYSRFDAEAFRELFAIKEKFREHYEKKEGCETFEEALARIKEENAQTPALTLLFRGTYCHIEVPYATCFRTGFPGYTENNRLKAVYDFLGSLGYVMADEERALMDGTHELYEQPEPAEPTVDEEDEAAGDDPDAES